MEKSFLKLLAVSGGITLILATALSCTERKQYKHFLDDNFARGKMSDELINQATPGAIALIGCCLYYESELQKGAAAGQKWVYTNSGKYAPQNTSFDNMVDSGHWGVNCAMPASWAYVDMGIMNEGMRFWGDRNGAFAKYDKVKDSLEQAIIITQLDGEKPFSELFAAGTVKPGDVFLAKGHTFIYLGDDLFFAAGHDGRWHTDLEAETEDPRQAVFESWIMPREACANNACCPTWQLSFKEDYIPAFYRNAEGEIVSYGNYSTHEE